MKVAIVGAAPTSQMLAPFDDYSWNIWVLGNQLSSYDGKRIDLAFEIHDDLSEHPPEYPEWLVKYAPRVVVGDHFPIYGLEIYPYNEVSSILGGEYLSSSIAYMFGYAVLKGATDIAIYGVDMGIENHEYFKQRPDIYAWIGYALGKGINVTIPDESPLFKPGYNEGRDWGAGRDEGIKPFTQKDFNEQAEKHKKRMHELRQNINDLELKLRCHQGAMETYEHLAKVARGLAGGTKVKNLSDVTVIG